MITNFARVANHIRSVRPKWLVLTVAVTVAVASACFAPMVLASSNGKWESGSHLVTFYDEGVEKTIITKGNSIKDALRDAEITIDDNDKIDPGINAELTDSMTVVNIRRARPVTVVDSDGRRSRVVTADVDAGQIAKQAGTPLQSHDTTRMSAADDFVSSGGAGQELTIARAKTVNVTLYGQKLIMRTQQKTVKDFLAEAGVKLANSDTTSVPLNTPITEGLAFQVWRNGVQTIEQTEDVPFETQTIEDNTKKIGYSEVQTAGQNGKKTVIYQVNMQNGVEVSRQKISEVVTVPAVKQIVVKGTKVDVVAGSPQDWMSQAGIPSSDWAATDYIISHESGWNPRARNASSGAYGLPQALPGSKMASAGSNWADNPVTQLKWFYSYCKGRYGSIQGAYSYWLQHHSY